MREGDKAGIIIVVDDSATSAKVISRALQARIKHRFKQEAAIHIYDPHFIPGEEFIQGDRLSILAFTGLISAPSDCEAFLAQHTAIIPHVRGMVVDYNMHPINGAELVRRMQHYKQEPYHSTMYIVGISAEEEGKASGESVLSHFTENGADAVYVKKVFQIPAILDVALDFMFDAVTKAPATADTSSVACVWNKEECDESSVNIRYDEGGLSTHVQDETFRMGREWDGESHSLSVLVRIKPAKAPSPIPYGDKVAVYQHMPKSEEELYLENAERQLQRGNSFTSDLTRGASTKLAPFSQVKKAEAGGKIEQRGCCIIT